MDWFEACRKGLLVKNEMCRSAKIWTLRDRTRLQTRCVFFRSLVNNLFSPWTRVDASLSSVSTWYFEYGDVSTCRAPCRTANGISECEVKKSTLSIQLGILDQYDPQDSTLEAAENEGTWYYRTQSTLIIHCTAPNSWQNLVAKPTKNEKHREPWCCSHVPTTWVKATFNDMHSYSCFISCCNNKEYRLGQANRQIKIQFQFRGSTMRTIDFRHRVRQR